MKAMIFAAGLGTRLLPLTENKPKALVEINNIPLLEIVISKLIKSGFKEIIINVHHFADMIIDFLSKKNNFGINIQISDERDLLLDTGGGLKKASWFFSDGNPFLIYNVDILSDIDLKALYNHHCKSNSIVTLAVRNRQTNRYLLFDKNNRLCGWKNIKTGEVRLVKKSDAEFGTLSLPQIPLAYSGIQVISPAIFDMMPDEKIFSIINFYLNIAADNNIQAYVHNEKYWLDLGRKENVEKASQLQNLFTE